MKNNHVDVERALVAGGAAATAFLATTYLDSKLSSHPYNDVKLVGQMLTTKSPFWQLQGVAGHYSFASVMALIYARYAYKRLPGPGWLRGLLFLQIENNSLYVLAPLLDRFHAGKKAGQLPPLMNLKTYMGQALRHVVFGMVLGAVYGVRRNT